jgi:hypothetical protein
MCADVDQALNLLVDKTIVDRSAAQGEENKVRKGKEEKNGKKIFLQQGKEKREREQKTK